MTIFPAPRTLWTCLLLIASATACDFELKEGTGESGRTEGGGTEGSGTEDGGTEDGGTSDTGGECTLEAKLCPDGSTVGRTGPNCEFAPCPGVCTDDALVCPDGSTVGRTGPNCEFAPCPACKPGDMTVAPDGCNDCFCQDDGLWACTLRACWDPCTDKACGEQCMLCHPDDPHCVEDAVIKHCDANGQCRTEPPVCSGCPEGWIWAESSCQDPPSEDYVNPARACYVPCKGSDDACPDDSACRLAWIETLCPCPPESDVCCDGCAGGKAWLCVPPL